MIAWHGVGMGLISGYAGEGGTVAPDNVVRACRAADRYGYGLACSSGPPGGDKGTRSPVSFTVTSIVSNPSSVPSLAVSLRVNVVSERQLTGAVNVVVETEGCIGKGDPRAGHGADPRVRRYGIIPVSIGCRSRQGKRAALGNCQVTTC